MKLPLLKKPAPNERRRTTTDNRAPLYSYHARRSQEPSTVGRQLFRPIIPAGQASRALRYSVRRFGIIAVLAAILVSLASILTLSTDVRVLPLDPDQRTFLRPDAVYQQAARKLFAGSITNRTKLTVDSAGISASLQRQFPELMAAAVKLPLIDRRPIVYLQPAAPTLTLTTVQGHSYVVDERGRVLAQAQGAAHAAALRLPAVKDNSGAAVSVGQQALPTSTVAFMRSVLFQLERKQLSVSSFVLPAGESELDTYIYGHAYFVKFNLAKDDTAQQQIGTFLAVRHRLQEQGTVPAEYIDVRVDGRAYYK